MGFILGLLGGWKVKLALAVLVVVALGGLWLLLGKAQAERDVAVLRLGAALAAVDELEAANAESLVELAGLERDYEAAQDNVKRLNVIVAGIEGAVSFERGAIANVDRAQSCPLPQPILDGLKRLRDGRAPRGDDHPD